MKVGVVGVGCSKFGRRDITLQELSFEAVNEALDDSTFHRIKLN